MTTAEMVDLARRRAAKKRVTKTNKGRTTPVPRPRLLDLFCGAGGAAMGYHRAGFDVVGVDINPQPNYPFTSVQSGWERWARDAERYFDAIHASPPCQAYCVMPKHRDDHPDLVDPVREALEASGLPWVIENVPTAPLRDPFVLCGGSFNLPVIRHRSFETSWAVENPPRCSVQTRFNRAVFHGPQFAPYARKTWEPRWDAEVLPVVWPWMTRSESGQAIPPAFTEFIGASLLRTL